MHKDRTDLAMERINPDESCPGVEIRHWMETDIEISEVIIQSEEAARSLGKPCGNYLSMECRLLSEHDPDARIAMASLLGEELIKMLPQDESAPVLVVGLGNRDVTPDSLGPLAIEKTLVTRHIMDSAHSPLDLRSVCAAAPGVLGVTGIETVEIVESLVKKLRPSAVICIDSLAARDSNRIGCTLQLTNTGIQPGSGVGNHRKPLTKATLGVDVIALGVPTVVYAATLARDAFSMIADTPDEEKLTQMETDLFGTELGNLIVTPRDIDSIVKNCAAMIASGINHALQPSLSSAQIAQMMD
ncbi:MAG: GPR endopeptidase [Clostridia bacterium]|nr:GPR endopeptidase [Clostridia bacterium]